MSGTATSKRPKDYKGQENSAGMVRVHESVISSIVRKAAVGAEGVVRLAGSSLIDNLAEIVGSKSMQDRAISVEIGDGTVSVELRVILEYGVYIPTIAKNLQNLIASALADMTGMTVSKVNIVVMDIEESKPEGSI